MRLPLLVAATLCAVCVLTAQAAPSRKQAELGARDKRLNGTVSLEAHHQPMPAFLEALTAKTGVSLRATGPAAEVRVTALLRNRPAREVLAGLAEMFHLTWRTEQEAEAARYVLLQSQADRAAAESGKARDWVQFRENVRKLIAAAGGAPLGDGAFDRMARSLGRDSGINPAALMLVALPDTMLDQVLRGERLQVPYSQMSPGLQTAFRRHRGQSRASQAAFRQLEAETTNTPQRPLLSPPPLEQLTLEVKRKGEGLHGQLSITTLDAGGQTQGGVGFGMNPQWSMDREDQERIQRHWGERHCNLPEEETLSHVPTGQPEYWEKLLLRFAEENEVSVLSDAYDIVEDLGTHLAEPLSEGATREQLLDRLCLAHEKTWNAETPLLLFRSQDWYFIRDREIPPTVEARWKQYARTTGNFPLDELALIAEMYATNEGQRGKMLRYVGWDATGTVRRNNNLLRLWGRLTPQQRHAAKADGLPVDEFQLTQRPLLEALVVEVRPDAMGIGQGFRRLRAEEADAKGEARVRLLFRDGQEIPILLKCRARIAQDPFLTARAIPPPRPVTPPKPR